MSVCGRAQLLWWERKKKLDKKKLNYTLIFLLVELPSTHFKTSTLLKYWNYSKITGNKSYLYTGNDTAYLAELTLSYAVCILNKFAGNLNTQRLLPFCISLYQIFMMVFACFLWWMSHWQVAWILCSVLFNSFSFLSSNAGVNPCKGSMPLFNYAPKQRKTFFFAYLS